MILVLFLKDEIEATNDLEKDNIYDAWPMPDSCKNLNNPPQFDREFVFSFHTQLVILCLHMNNGLLSS
jgi:hypothetical protein